MYSIVLLAALTTGVDMPDRGGRRGGGCCGCYGGGGYGMGYGGCYGGGYGMGMGGGGCYGGMGMGMGWGGCYGGMGMGWGGGYGGSRMVGGYGMSGGWGYGNSGYALNNYSFGFGNNAYSPMMSNWGTPIVSAGGTMLNSGGLTQSFYFNPAGASGATIIVHVPANASLSIDGQQTQQRSDYRVFTSPPLQSGKTYTYTLRAEMNRDGRLVHEEQKVDVQAGRSSEVRFNLEGSNRGNNDNEPATENRAPARRTLPTPPPDR